jgi:hypothetical protein
MRNRSGGFYLFEDENRAEKRAKIRPGGGRQI